MTLTRLDAALDDGVVRLREWTYGDLACLREASLDASIPEGTTVPAQYSDLAAREFVERQWSRNDSGQGWSLAIADAMTDEALGCAVLLLRPQEYVAGIGYWLVPRARRRRYGSRAVTLLTAWGLAEGGMERVEAWVEPGNVASARLLEGCGYVLEGRFGHSCHSPRGAPTHWCSRGCGPTAGTTAGVSPCPDDGRRPPLARLSLGSTSSDIISD